MALFSVLLRQLSPDKDLMLRFDGIGHSEEDRIGGAIIPEFSEITADLIAHNLLVAYYHSSILQICREIDTCN